MLQTRSIEIKIAEDEPSEEKRPRLKVKDDENANERFRKNKIREVLKFVCSAIFVDDVKSYTVLLHMKEK